MSGYSKMVLIPENEYKNMIKSKTLDNQFLNNANAKQMTNIVASDLDKIDIQFDQGQDKGTIRIKNNNTEEEMKKRTLQNQSTQTQLYNKPTSEKPILHKTTLNEIDNNNDNNNHVFTTKKQVYTKPHKPRPYMRDQNAYSVPIISNSNPNPVIISNPIPNSIIMTPNSNTTTQVIKPPIVQIQNQDNQNKNMSSNSDQESEMEIDENQPKSSLRDQESQTAMLSRNQETQTEMKLKPFMRDQNMQTEFTSEQGVQTDRLASIRQKDFSTQMPLTSTFGMQTENIPVHKEIEIQTNFPEKQIHITPKTTSEIETQTDFPHEQHTLIPPVSMQTEEITSTPIQSNIISDPISNPSLPNISESEHISNPIPIPPIYEPLAIGDVESPIITDVTDIPELTYDTRREDDIILENYPLSNFPLTETRQNVIRINDENLPQFANFSEYPPNFYYLNRDDDTYRTVLSPQNYPQIRNASFNMFNDNQPLTHRPSFSLAPEIRETLQNEHLIPSLTYQRRSEIPALTYSSRSNDQAEKSREKRRQNIQQQREKKKDQMSHRKLHENKYEDEEPIPSTSYAFKPKPNIKPKPDINPEPEPKVVIEESAEQQDVKPKKEFKHKGKGKKSKRKPRNDGDDYKDEKDREKRRETLSNVRKKAKDKSLGRSAEWLREMGITGQSKKQNIRKRSHYDYDTDPENTFATETYEYRKQRIPKKKVKKKTS